MDRHGIAASAESASSDLAQDWRKSELEDQATVAALDIAYQAAVKRNDADAMDQILHDKYALILGDGTVITREELLGSARNKVIEYEIQDEDPGTQEVRTWGDTAVVTARLWIKGHRDGLPIERRLWFSDTYVRTATGWRYAFAQASLPLPAVPTSS